jgi:hypothetical protein
VVLSANVLSMTISVVLVIYDIATGHLEIILFVLYDIVIINHYFASGIPACYILEFQPTTVTIGSNFTNTIYD